jgi:uncharacterized YccA/Bax inhibitor family protein
VALFKSGNPALREDTFTAAGSVDESNAMTLQGTVNKTGILLVAVLVPAIYVWDVFYATKEFQSIAAYFYVGLIGGFITALVLVFNKPWAPYLAVVYALLEGMALGGLSALMEYSYPGIVIEALMLTFGIFFCLLLIYKLEIIKATENFKLIVASATGGIALYYVLTFAFSFFGISLPLVNDSSVGGIIFSLFVVAIASMNLVVDFDFIERGVEARAPKYMEWYGAFGLMVTLIWLYIEILRLLAKSRRR